MAKVKGSNPPYSDWVYTDESGEDYLLGTLIQQALKDPYLSPSSEPTKRGAAKDAGETDITGQSVRGRRPTQQGDGTLSQKYVRDIFRECTDLWNAMVEHCPVPATTPPTTSKDSVWAAKIDYGVVCSYYDLWMRCCSNWAFDHDGDMPDGDCFPCENACDCEGISIGYTTNGMSINEQQTLFVIDSMEGCVYSWEITSGGGSLSSETGESVVYTAPASNPECNLNPTITLSCGGSIYDTLMLSVNAYETDIGAYQITYECQAPCQESVGALLCGYQDPGYSGKYCFACGTNNYDCNGDLRYTQLRSAASNLSASSCATFYTRYCDKDQVLTDLRSAALKTAGCCPAELM